MGNYSLSLPDTPANEKIMIVLAHSIRQLDGTKAGLTFQEISEILGHADRQWSNNFWREYEAAGGDILAYLKRKKRLEDEAFSLIETQILAQPLLSLSAHYQRFCAAHPELTMCRATFDHYVSQVDGCRLLQRIQQLLVTEKVSLDSDFYLQELLNRLEITPNQRKEIRELFPSAAAGETAVETKAVNPSEPKNELKILVLLLYASGMSLEMLGLLFDRCRTAMHNWVYAVAGESLETYLLSQIKYWSGQVCFDEKWVKVDGVWQFVLCAVDAVSGFPLLMRVHPTLDAVSWQVFMLEFKSIYGTPKLIISDGCQKLALARSLVFAGVVYQLCKFHKLKNLLKKIRSAGLKMAEVARLQRLAGHIFTNATVSSRKQAAKTLAGFSAGGIGDYVQNRILADWIRLAKSLTNNAAERWNRKIEKAFSGRYGIKNEQCAQVILRGLWLKEWLLNGHVHSATNPRQAINLARIGQTYLTTDKIQRFFQAMTA
jgi:transposase-like protein